MDFLFGIIFRENIDHLIREKRFWLIVITIFFIFGLFVAIDLSSALPVENYHAEGRIFFPPEFTRKLIFFQVIAFLFTLPFLSSLPIYLNKDKKRESIILSSPYNKAKIAVQRIMAVLVPVFLIQILFFTILFLSMYINHDATCLTILKSQLILLVLSVFYLCSGLFLGLLLKSSFFPLFVNSILTIFLIFDIYIIGPLLSTISEPETIIDFALLINPFSVISSAINYDVMRSGFLYQTAQVVMYRFNYPSIMEFFGVFGIASLVMFLFGVLIMFKSKNICDDIFNKKSNEVVDIKFELDNSIDLLISQRRYDALTKLLSDKFGSKKKVSQFLGNIGFVSDSNAYPYDWETPCFHLVFFAKLYGEKNEKIETILKEAGLSEYSYKKMKDLTESQKKLIVLLRSLINKSELIIWDNPFPSLEDRDRKIALRILRKFIGNDKKAIIISPTVCDIINYGDIDRIIYLTNNKNSFDLKSDKINEEILYKIFSGWKHENQK